MIETRISGSRPHLLQALQALQDRSIRATDPIPQDILPRRGKSPPIIPRGRSEHFATIPCAAKGSLHPRATLRPIRRLFRTPHHPSTGIRSMSIGECVAGIPPEETLRRLRKTILRQHSPGLPHRSIGIRLTPTGRCAAGIPPEETLRRLRKTIPRQHSPSLPHRSIRTRTPPRAAPPAISRQPPSRNRRQSPRIADRIR